MPRHDLFGDIPNIPTLEVRFGFIDNPKTRQNVTVCFQYIMFLILASEASAKSGALELSIYRDIIVHTASIIETCLHYCLITLGERGKLDMSKLEAEWKYKEAKLIYAISETEQIVWAHKQKTTKALASNPSSESISKAAKIAGILDEPLFEKAEALRNARNKIHLVGKEEENLYPTKAEVDDMFTSTKDILASIKSALAA